MSHQSSAESIHHRTLEDVIPLFSSTTQPCIIDQIGCIVIFHQIVRDVGAHGAGTRGSMRSAHDACFTWLTRPRSGQELLELGQSQCTCGPMATGMSRHQVGLAVMSDRAGNTPLEPFFLLAEFILLFFSVAAGSDLTIAEETRQRVQRLHHRRNWPGTWQEMLPHGPRDTIFALIALLDIQPPIKHRCMSMKVIEKIVRNCHPLVLRVLFNSPATLIHGIVTSVDACQHDLEHQADLGDPSLLAEAEDCLCTITNLFIVLFKFAHEVQRRTFHTIGGYALLTAYSRAVSICQLLATRGLGDQSSRMVSAFGNRGGDMYNDCSDARDLDINIEAARLFDKATGAFRTAETVV
jgi:hypothetical protein